MSKAFTKDDAAEVPLVLPRRAPLPAGTPNYVTARGLSRLQGELGELIQRRASVVQSADAGEGVAHAARLLALEQRIASAVLVDSSAQPRDEVRFGASVEVVNPAGARRRYRIVGVDEADAEQGAIAFVAPLSRALLGLRVGDVASVKTPAGEDELEILKIVYE
jgi:transcription elongation factor GreB